MAKSADRASGLGKALGEFAIVVVGVLVALFVESWWQGLEEADRIDQYLVQLAEDATNNATELADALAEESNRIEVLDSILVDLEAPARISRDAAILRLAGVPTDYSDPRIRLGTIDALLATGDFRLIRDPAIRSALISYTGAISADREEFDRWVDHALGPIQEVWDLKLAYDLTRVALQERVRPEILVAGRREVSIIAIYSRLHLSSHNRTSYLRRMASATADLLETLQASET